MVPLHLPGNPRTTTASISRHRLACAVALSLFCTTLGHTAEPRLIRVQPEKAAETFEGWGTSLCWFANAVGRWPEPQRSAVADALFASTGLGLTFVRYNIGGGEHPDHNHMPWFRQMEGFAPRPGEWNWAADPGQRWMLAAALQRGATRVEAFSNAPPHWMTLSGCVSGNADPNRDNLDPRHESAFVDYLATVVQQFETRWGIRFDTIDPMNEPYTDYWRANGKQEGCHFERATQARLIRSLRAALDQRGLHHVGISAADETSYARAIDTWKTYDPETRACVSVINAHAYNTAGRAELRALALESQRPLVMSEVDGNGGAPHNHADIAPAIVLAGQIVDDLRDLRPRQWTFWQAVEDESGMVDANANWGLIHADLQGDTHVWVTTKKYYAMAQFSKFIRPGAVWATSDDPDTVAMIDRTHGTLIIVARNARPTEEPVTYDVSQFAGAAVRAEVYRTAETEDLATLPAQEVSPDGRLSVSLAAGSITTFVVPLRPSTPSE